VLLRICLTLLLDLSLLLINLRIDLLLDLAGRFPLLDQLILHLLRFVVDLLLQFFVLGGQFFILFSDLVYRFYVLGVFFLKLSFDAVEVLIEPFLNLSTFVAFLLGDLDVAGLELLVLFVVFAG